MRARVPINPRGGGNVLVLLDHAQVDQRHSGSINHCGAGEKKKPRWRERKRNRWGEERNRKIESFNGFSVPEKGSSPPTRLLSHAP